MAATKQNSSYIVNEYTKQAIALTLEEAKYLATNSILIIAERIAIDQLNKEAKTLSDLKIQLRKMKVLREIKRTLKETEKIKKLANTNIYSVDIHAQDFEWTKEDMKHLYFDLHEKFRKVSNSKIDINKKKKLDFYSKFINKIMILYPQWETERLMNIDSYVNNPINGFDNSKNKYNIVGITKNKISQLRANDKTGEYKTFLIPQKYWDRKKVSEVKHFYSGNKKKFGSKYKKPSPQTQEPQLVQEPNKSEDLVK